MQDAVYSHSYAVIMAGGKGERFWPLSTERRPKQLLALAGGKPLVVQAMDRLEGVVPPDHILIATNASLVEPIRGLLGERQPLYYTAWVLLSFPVWPGVPAAAVSPRHSGSPVPGGYSALT